MPPEERRAAIVAATLPLLLERGLPLTTREIAEAAGIAEGTIFRVFPDKEAVVEATVEAAFDQGPPSGRWPPSTRRGPSTTSWWRRRRSCRPACRCSGG